MNANSRKSRTRGALHRLGIAVFLLAPIIGSAQIEIPIGTWKVTSGADHFLNGQSRKYLSCSLLYSQWIEVRSADSCIFDPGFFTVDPDKRELGIYPEKLVGKNTRIEARGNTLSILDRSLGRWVQFKVAYRSPIEIILKAEDGGVVKLAHAPDRKTVASAITADSITILVNNPEFNAVSYYNSISKTTIERRRFVEINDSLQVIKESHSLSIGQFERLMFVMNTQLFPRANASLYRLEPNNRESRFLRIETYNEGKLSHRMVFTNEGREDVRIYDLVEFVYAFDTRP